VNVLDGSSYYSDTSQLPLPIKKKKKNYENFLSVKLPPIIFGGNDTNLGSALNTLEGREAIQRDLDRLERWAHANLVKARLDGAFSNLV